MTFRKDARVGVIHPVICLKSIWKTLDLMAFKHCTLTCCFEVSTVIKLTRVRELDSWKFLIYWMTERKWPWKNSVIPQDLKKKNVNSCLFWTSSFFLHIKLACSEHEGTLPDRETCSSRTRRLLPVSRTSVNFSGCYQMFKSKSMEQKRRS